MFFFILGSASLNAKANGKIVVRTVSYFLITSLLSAILGIILAIAIHPGSPSTKKALGTAIIPSGGPQNNVNILDGFLDLGRNIFPDNIFQASFQQVSNSNIFFCTGIHNLFSNQVHTVNIENDAVNVTNGTSSLTKKVK